MKMSSRDARPKQRRKVAAYVVGCIGLGALFLVGPAHAQFYCANPLSAFDVGALMAEAPLAPPFRPAVAAVHRSATREPAPRIGVLAVFPRFIEGDRWPEMPIKYFIHSSATNRRQQLDVAIAEWEAKTVVRFKEINEEEARGSPHFVVRGDVQDNVCRSWGLGYLKGDDAQIDLGSRCTAGQTIHEIGHRLGLMHEHERSDRDRYIAIKWEEVVKAVKAIEGMNEKEKASLLSNLGELADLWEVAGNWLNTNHVSDYDLVSIMHYGPNLKVIGKFFEPTDEGRRSLATRFGANATQAVSKIGQRDCITKWDADAINARYKGVR